jgi:aspartate 1-decarboxylase
VTLLKCKLHRACVTHAELDYEGSCAIDEHLMRLAGIREYEQIQIYNVANGERFTTYAIRAEAGSRVISVNGAAAHKASPGDRVIICAYAGMDEADADAFEPRLVYLDEHNRVTRTGHAIPAQAA